MRPTLALLAAGFLSTLTPAFGTEPQVIVDAPVRSLNELVLRAIRTMPSGGSYSVNATANRALESAIAVTPFGLRIETSRAYPSYCSSATYLVFLRTLDELVRSGRLSLDGEALTALAVSGQRDGEGIWGRWNANGPGTARLFTELGLGSNFTDFDAARPGDFLKIFWTTEVGRHERGHSVIYLGKESVEGTEHVRFWSSNDPFGYGVKTVPRKKIAQAVFSRLETPANLGRATTLPPVDRYLASLLRVRSSFAEIRRHCGL